MLKNRALGILNSICEKKIERLCPHICACSQSFLALPVSFASGAGPFVLGGGVWGVGCGVSHPSRQKFFPGTFLDTRKRTIRHDHSIPCFAKQGGEQRQK